MWEQSKHLLWSLFLYSLVKSKYEREENQENIENEKEKRVYFMNNIKIRLLRKEININKENVSLGKVASMTNFHDILSLDIHVFFIRVRDFFFQIRVISPQSQITFASVRRLQVCSPPTLKKSFRPKMFRVVTSMLVKCMHFH